MVAHIHRALQTTGHDSIVLTTGVSTRDCSVLRIARSPSAFGLVALKYAALARDVDVVHIHHGEGIGLLWGMRAQGIRTPVLLTMHVSVAAMRRSLGPYTLGERTFHRDSLRSWAHRHLTMRLRTGLDNAAMRLADRVTFISRSAARDVLGPDAGSRATVIYNGVPSAPDIGTSLPSTELLFVGSNTERKRVELLPLILAHVRQQRPNARLRIVGLAANENQELVSLAHEHKVLDAIEFAGRVKPGELGPYYRSAKVLLVPSAYEGLPMVILEAMQHGLPVVATRVSGHPEVIEDAVNGFLVPLDNPPAMSNAVLRILEDASLGARFSATAQSAVCDRFSVDQQMSSYVAEYEQLARTRDTRCR